MNNYNINPSLAFLIEIAKEKNYNLYNNIERKSYTVEELEAELKEGRLNMGSAYWSHEKPNRITEP